VRDDHPPLGWLQLAAATWILGPLLHGPSAVADARSLMLIPTPRPDDTVQTRQLKAVVAT
jgi:hypothetical protein